MKRIKELLNWTIKDVIKMLIGTLMFCIAINVFVVPNDLYTGGILGLSQLINKEDFYVQVSLFDQEKNIKECKSKLLVNKLNRKANKDVFILANTFGPITSYIFLNSPLSKKS